jgi:CheY-like chemotaxis protein
VTGRSVRPTVLLVEDELDCSATLAVAFEGGDAPPFQHTSTAEQAWAILRDGPVAALITDINLPAMDGLELIRRVRAEPRMAALPIVVTSADADPATHERALQLGANAFFPKPYSPFALRQKIEELIRET